MGPAQSGRSARRLALPTSAKGRPDGLSGARPARIPGARARAYPDGLGHIPRDRRVHPPRHARGARSPLLTMDAPAVPGGSPSGASEHHLRQLTPLLVWAVVFCDIGTSIYYVPGILYKTEGVGNLAPLFVFAAFIGFLLLAWKYIEICWRNPDGGGVVTVANQAFSPIVGCFGGLLICVDYFLTSAISSVSGIHYLASVLPGLGNHVVALSVATLLLLAAVNTIGSRESAALALVMALGGLASGLLIIVAVLRRRRT